jgi:hypothetical protein
LGAYPYIIGAWMAQQQFYLKHFQISEQRKRKTWKYIHVFQKFHIKLQNYFSIYFTKQINGPIVFNVLREALVFSVLFNVAEGKGTWMLGIIFSSFSWEAYCLDYRSTSTMGNKEVKFNINTSIFKRIPCAKNCHCQNVEFSVGKLYNILT